MQNTHIIETALLLLLAFLIGCAIGWFVRTRFYSSNVSATSPVKEPAAAVTPDTASAAAATASTAEPVAPAAPAPAKAEEGSKPAARKPAAAKPAAKTTAKKPAAPKAAAKKSAAPKKPAATKPAAPKAEPGKPEGLSAPRAGGKDDLKKISGVGPKLEEKLNGLGIYHFDQIAAWDKKTVNWVDDHLSFKGRIERDEWIKQAKALAKE